MKKGYVYLLSFLFIITAGTVYDYFQPSDKEIALSEFEKMKFQQYTGVVREKYREKNNHNFPLIIINNQYGNQKIYLTWDRSGLFEYIEKGDSIFKKYGKHEVEIKRQGKTIKFKLQPN